MARQLLVFFSIVLMGAIGWHFVCNWLGLPDAAVPVGGFILGAGAAVYAIYLDQR